MKFIHLVSAFFTANTAAALTILDKRATTWCDAFGSLQAGPYTVFHNNWGANTASSGSQCTTFSTLNGNSVQWSTDWSWAGGAGHVKSYSNVALEKVNKKLSDIQRIPTTWTWSYTGSNMVADVSFDLWLAPTASSNNEYEIMIWVGSYGGAGPISSTGSTPIATPTILGTKWKLFKGPNGDTTVFSFVAPSNIKNWNGDLKAFFTYLTSKEGVSVGMVVTSLQAGTEPFSGTNAHFKTTAYTISVQ
ncbi:xyloglucan-specific endo-beta-1,4-glucanase [Trichoderma asperellum]|nr:glycoside hydrolase family 12 protein [Trichoderma asperelloides]